VVYVLSSTLNWIEETVDANGGAVVIRNASVRDREGKDRLRLTRLQAVRNTLVRRGLRTFPNHLTDSGEDRSFVVYRPEVLIVDIDVIASDAKVRAAMEFVVEVLQRSPREQIFVNGQVFCRKLRSLASARPEIQWRKGLAA
jgi:hypothetical protein